VADAKKPLARASGGGYLNWSRDPAVGFFSVVPLWLCYELLRLQLAPHERNLSEWYLLDVFARAGGVVTRVVQIAFLVGVFVAMRSVVRRQIPWARVGLVVILEGMVYGLLLGPLAGALAEPATRMLAAFPGRERLVYDLVGSLGAGIFEELVFRLGLMSLLVWAWMRLARDAAVARVLGCVVAVLLSALLFSWHHHLREPFDFGVFMFRTMAGVLLGLLFWFRGFGVCVYTHAMYNVHFFLSQSP
jgi:hypothetical protein